MRRWAARLGEVLKEIEAPVMNAVEATLGPGRAVLKLARAQPGPDGPPEGQDLGPVQVLGPPIRGRGPPADRPEARGVRQVAQSCHECSLG